MESNSVPIGTEFDSIYRKFIGGYDQNYTSKFKPVAKDAGPDYIPIYLNSKVMLHPNMYSIYSI